MGFFKMFKKPKIAVKVELDKKTLVLGANTNGTITVSSKEEFDATEIRAELRCIEKIRRERMVYTGRHRRPMRQVYWESATLLADDLKASGSMHIVPGLKKKFPIKVNIPAGGRETLEGMDANVSWFIKGVVCVDGRPDATSDTIELQVVRATSGTVVKEDVEMVPCEYCRALMPVTSSSCPICGAPRKS
ncbi:MAG: hypothetical protein NWF06_00955 [Candidatus Bathyarchaeota archaeon]|nr:hypothetical protein [Candidatus Bathyarchaeum sp.]